MFKVSVRGLNKALKTLNNLSIEQRLDLFLKRVAGIGAVTAKVGYDNFEWTEYERQNNEMTPVPRRANVTVTVEKTEKGYNVSANGEQLFFIEFGAGVYYNGFESYPGDRPPGIVGIGEYGKGLGKKEGWFYKSGTYTHGNMPSASMYYAAEDMKREIRKIAEEIFE